MENAQLVGDLRRSVVAYADRLGACNAVCDAVALAVSEAVTNVIIHAYVGRCPGEVILEAFRDDGQLVVLVCDDGRGMLPRTDSPGLGLGMSLMAQMADELHVTDRPDCPGTKVQLAFSLDGSGTAAAGPLL